MTALIWWNERVETRRIFWKPGRMINKVTVIADPVRQVEDPNWPAEVSRSELYLDYADWHRCVYCPAMEAALAPAAAASPRLTLMIPAILTPPEFHSLMGPLLYVLAKPDQVRVRPVLNSDGTKTLKHFVRLAEPVVHFSKLALMVGRVENLEEVVTPVGAEDLAWMAFNLLEHSENEHERKGVRKARMKAQVGASKSGA